MLTNLKTQISNTDIFISPAGLGTVKFGRNTGVKYPNTFNLPNDAEIKNILSVAKSLGINLIDTAPAYGNSEKRIGKNLANRKEWIISSKVGETFNNNQSTFDYSRKGILKSIDNSLLELKTDYIDIVLIHSNGDDLQIINETDIIEILDKLKQKGIIRAIGISGKTSIGAIKALETMDIAMITHNKTYQEEYDAIEFANKNNKSIFIKKVFNSGYLDKSEENPIQATMDFVFKSKINSVILGTLNEKHLLENCEAIRNSLNKR